MRSLGLIFQSAVLTFQAESVYDGLGARGHQLSLHFLKNAFPISVSADPLGGHQACGASSGLESLSVRSHRFPSPFPLPPGKKFAAVSGDGGRGGRGCQAFVFCRTS